MTLSHNPQSRNFDNELAVLASSVWSILGKQTDALPPSMLPTYEDLDDLLSTTAWGDVGREKFLQRWLIIRTLLPNASA